MRDVSLCFLRDSQKILLGLKKRGFGEGKLNGYGGKLEKGETVEQAAVRELFEESGVKVSLDSLRKMAEIDFHWPTVPEQKWDQRVHVFFIENWDGEPVETDEMKPLWTPLNEIPFEKMWNDDKHWLPLLLKGDQLKAKFVFADDKETIVDMDMKQGSYFN